MAWLLVSVLHQKFTTSEYLTNNLLRIITKVFYIDFDPGQVEFTPALSVLLTEVQDPVLDPNFTHFSILMLTNLTEIVKTSASNPNQVASLVNFILYIKFSFEICYAIQVVNLNSWYFSKYRNHWRYLSTTTSSLPVEISCNPDHSRG